MKSLFSALLLLYRGLLPVLGKQTLNPECGDLEIWRVIKEANVPDYIFENETLYDSSALHLVDDVARNGSCTQGWTLCVILLGDIRCGVCISDSYRVERNIDRSHCSNNWRENLEVATKCSGSIISQGEMVQQCQGADGECNCNEDSGYGPCQVVDQQSCTACIHHSHTSKDNTKIFANCKNRMENVDFSSDLPGSAKFPPLGPKQGKWTENMEYPTSQIHEQNQTQETQNQTQDFRLDSSVPAKHSKELGSELGLVWGNDSMSTGDGETSVAGVGNLLAWLGMMLAVLGLVHVLRKIYKKREMALAVERRQSQEFERNSYYHNYLKNTEDRTRKNTINMELALAALRSIAVAQPLREGVFSARPSHLKHQELLRRSSV